MNILKLTVEENGEHIRTEEFSTDSIVSIGRGEQNVLVLESSNVSRNHCQLIFENGSWKIEDLGSTNGVELDGVRVSKEAVKNRSVLSVRPFLLTINLPSEEADDTPSEGTLADVDLTLLEDETAFVDATQTDLTNVEDEEEQTMVGTSVGEDGTFVQGEIKQNFILVQNGLSSGVSVPLFEQNLIGSRSGCDLVLRDIGIESEHLQIRYDGSRYSFTKLSNSEPLSLNGKNVSKGFLKDGDSLMLGEIELCLKIQSGVKGAGIIGFIQDNLKVVLLLLLLVMMGFAFMALLGDGGKPGEEQPVEPPSVGSSVENPAPESQEVENESAALSLEHKRQYARLIYKAKQFMAAGDFKRASNRLDAALGIDPQASEAEELFQQCQESISRAKKEAAERVRLTKEYTSKTLVKVSQVEKYIQSGDLMSAMDIIKELNVRKNEYPELVDLHSRIKKLENRIEQDEREHQEKRAGKKQSFEQQLVAVRSAFEQGMVAYKSGDFHEARAQWAAVVATKIGVPERKKAEGYLKELDGMLREKTKSNYDRAVAAMRGNDSATALYYYHRVLEIDPDHSDVKVQYEKLLALQIKEAQHYYQKGLVYEGINNIDRAGKDWKKVLEVLPIDDSGYHVKAKRKLTEYGLQ